MVTRDTDRQSEDTSHERRSYLKLAGASVAGTIGGVALYRTVESSESRSESGSGDDSSSIAVSEPTVGALRDAIDTLGTDPGTITVESELVDDIGDNVVIPSNTHLRGAGQGSTRLRLADDPDLELAGLLRVEGSDVVISDMTLDGNRAEVDLSRRNDGQEYGFYTSGAERVAVQRVTATSFPGYGFDPHANDSGPSRDIVLEDCRATNNGYDGITFAGVETGTIRDCVSYQNDRHGVNMTDEEGHDITVKNAVSRENGGCGLVVQNLTGDVTVTASSFRGNVDSGIRLGSSGNLSRDVTVTDNRIASNGSYGLNVRLAQRVVISDNLFRRNDEFGEATAEIVIKGAEEQFSQSIQVSENVIECRNSTEWAVEERPMSGPTVIVHNLVENAGNRPFKTDHRDTVVRENVSA